MGYAIVFRDACLEIGAEVDDETEGSKAYECLEFLGSGDAGSGPVIE